MSNVIRYILAGCLVLMTGDREPQTVEKAIPVMSPGFMTCGGIAEGSIIADCKQAEYQSGWTCKDETRVIMKRVNGEVICVRFDAAQPRAPKDEETK